MQQTTRLVLWKNIALTAGILAATTCLCLLLRRIDGAGAYASELFLLAVFLISRFTTGYLWGVVASLLSVLAVNFLFTYPYYAFNFTISGYPLTMLCMLAVSIITGAMTTQIKRQGDLRIEAEREKTRGNLLRAVSHDLRTPLTSISAAASLLSNDKGDIPPQRRRAMLAEISDDAQWLIRMVENLLSITRVGEAADVRKTPEAAEEVISEAVRKYRARFESPAASVSLPEELVMVPMDAILIRQVLSNLLENAAFHAQGAKNVRVTLRVEGDTAVFEVADDGAGIPEAKLRTLFDPSAASPSDNAAHSRNNMGIGLSVCRTIVMAHGGALSAGNREGGGACFRFTLPMKEEETHA